ncbi:uncharacterized protein ACRADG_008991 [Cochliomyia hominivorax]
MAIVSGRIPLLNGKNFSTWFPQMEAVLHKNRLLRMVRGEIAKPEEVIISSNPTALERKAYEEFLKKKREYEDLDQDARAEIIICVEPDIIRMIKTLKSSNEIWYYLKNTYDRKSTRKKAELYKKLLNLKMVESQSISQYLVEFDVAVSELREMVSDVDEDFLTVMLLDGLQDKYKAVKAAFDTANEFPTLNVLRSKLLEIGDKPEEENVQDNALKVYKFANNKKKQGNFNYNKTDKKALIVAAICLTQAAITQKYFRDSNHPGKCVVEGKVLSPGEKIKHPTLECAEVTCDNSIGLATIETCDPFSVFSAPLQRMETLKRSDSFE